MRIGSSDRQRNRTSSLIILGVLLLCLSFANLGRNTEILLASIEGRAMRLDRLVMYFFLNKPTLSIMLITRKI
jgi:hypothetical protein